LQAETLIFFADAFGRTPASAGIARELVAISSLVFPIGASFATHRLKVSDLFNLPQVFFGPHRVSARGQNRATDIERQSFSRIERPGAGPAD
jgi:hypothetical protein